MNGERNQEVYRPEAETIRDIRLPPIVSRFGDDGS
jgi:hypothetical protein